MLWKEASLPLPAVPLARRAAFWERAGQCGLLLWRLLPQAGGGELHHQQGVALRQLLIFAEGWEWRTVQRCVRACGRAGGAGAAAGMEQTVAGGARRCAVGWALWAVLDGAAMGSCVQSLLQFLPSRAHCPSILVEIRL